MPITTFRAACHATRFSISRSSEVPHDLPRAGALEALREVLRRPRRVLPLRGRACLVSAVVVVGVVLVAVIAVRAVRRRPSADRPVAAPPVQPGRPGTG